MRRRDLRIAALFGALAVLSAPAAAAGKDFGTPPFKCGYGAYGSSGCYARDVGPKAMDDAGNGNIDISPHLVEVGGYLSMTVVGDSTPNWVPAAGIKPRKCKPGAKTCVFKAVAATSGWQRYSMGFGLGAIEQDYYGVTGKDRRELIEGTLSKLDRLPIKNAEVKISGRTSKTVKTDGAGSFRVKVKAGRYTVTPSPKVCLMPMRSRGCERSATVDVGPPASLRFRSMGEFTLKGMVRHGKCNSCGTEASPYEGAKVVAAPAEGGTPGEATTAADGTYEMKLPGDTYDVRVVDPASGSAPETRAVALTGDVEKIDFDVCPSAEARVSISLSQCTFEVGFHVADRAGDPVPNVELFASDTTNTLAKGFFGLNGGAKELTDQSGEAVMRLKEGMYEVSELADVGAVQEPEFQDALGYTTTRVTLCQPGEIKPANPEITRDDGAYNHCFLTLKDEPEAPVPVVNLEANLFPVTITNAISPGGLKLKFSDPDALPGVQWQQRGRAPFFHSLPTGARRNFVLRVPSVRKLTAAQTYIVELNETVYGEPAARVTACSPGEIRGNRCILRLDSKHPRGRVAFGARISRD